MDSKRLAIAFGISAAILVLWTILFPPPKPAPRPVPPTKAAEAVKPTAGPTAAGAVPEVAAAPATPAAATVEPIAAAEPREVALRNDVLSVRLSNRGGELVSAELARFLGHDGKPLELVRKDPPFAGRTLVYDPSDPFLARAAAAFHETTVDEGPDGTKVTFRYREADGQGVSRTYTFGKGYVLGVRVVRDGDPSRPVALVLGPGVGNPTKEELENRYTKPGSSVTLTAGRSVARKAKDGLKEAAPLGSGLLAAGLEDNYLVTAFLPGAKESVTLRPVSLVPPPSASVAGGPVPPAAPPALVESEVVTAGAGSLETGVYLGPKDIDVLRTVRPGMEKLIDYGWFAILVSPLLWLLKQFHAAIPNWGVAIILATVVIKVVLFPLTWKQLVSMKRMSTLQPKIEAIRLKWTPKLKSDPQARMKMNEETMALYKAEKVNPAGGCLPLLLQMPILIAFYNLLSHAIDLRHAPFALWIQDLSAKDPYYVTPILMTLTMWLQQQMMPATGDATTRRVMGFLPLVMGFMFKDMPSGLVLYWLVQNVLSIVQQLLLERYTDLGMRPKAAKKA